MAPARSRCYRAWIPTERVDAPERVLEWIPRNMPQRGFLETKPMETLSDKPEERELEEPKQGKPGLESSTEEARELKQLQKYQRLW